MESSTPIKQYFDIAWRRKWWIVVPMGLAAATSLVVWGMMPTVYRATTTILVTRQSVPEDIARSTVTLRIEERMRSLEVQILSRSYLERIAREFKMIPAGAGEAEIEDTCRTLGAKITPEFDEKDYSWFRISAEDVDPKRAAGIANRLADLFIEQNSRMRASQTAGTLEATENWEEKYRLELAKRDEAISEFKQQNIYELPDQQPLNVQLLGNAQNRSMQLTSDIQSLNDRLVALRSQQQPQPANDTPSGGDDPRLATARRELADLLGSYTEANPLVKRKREQIADLVRSPPPAAGPLASASPAIAARHDPIALQVVALESEITSLDRDRARENANIETYRARIGDAPVVQRKLLELTRDYDELKHQFDTAVVQREQAQRSQDLEGSNKGTQFRIQDRAYPTAVPSKRTLQYVMFVMSLGLGIGVAGTVARELLDQTVRSEEEFAAAFPDLPVYGVIPSLDVDPKSLAARSSAMLGRTA